MHDKIFIMHCVGGLYSAREPRPLHIHKLSCSHIHLPQEKEVLGYERVDPCNASGLIDVFIFHRHISMMVNKVITLLLLGILFSSGK